MPFTTNFSFTNIVNRLKNYEYLNDSSSTSTRTVSLSLCLDLEFERLELQSKLFASNFISHGYIEFPKTLRCKYDQVIGILEGIYIYSFTKALYNGLYFSNINDSTDQGLCLRGHVSLHQLLRSPSFYKVSETYSVYASLKLPGDIGKKVLISSILYKYPYLRDSIFNIDSVGNSPFMHYEWESRLQYLNDSFNTRNNILNKDPDDAAGTTASASNKTISDVKNDKGRLILLRLNADTASSITSDDNNPMLNVLLEKQGKILYFTPMTTKHSIENNCSFFFNLANFIRLENSTDINLSRFYFADEYSFESKKFFLCSEVFTNTGIKCTGYNINKPKDNDFFPKIEEIFDEVTKNPDSSIGAILNIIKEIINADIQRREVPVSGPK